MNQEEQSKLNKFNYYFVKSIEFYNLKKDAIAKVSFIINLICIFCAFTIPGRFVTWQIYGLYFVIFSIVTIAASAYLFAVIRELRGKEYSMRTCFKRIKKKSVMLISSSIVFGLINLIGIILLIIPGIYFSSIFFLHSCYILDLGESFEDSYEASNRLTKPYRDILFKYFFSFVLIIIVSGYIFLSLMATSGSLLILIISASFFGAAAILIYQRFVAYIYMDIEYKLNAAKRV